MVLYVTELWSIILKNFVCIFMRDIGLFAFFGIAFVWFLSG